MKRSEFDNFSDFYNDTLSKNKNTKDKRQFNFKTADNLFLRVPHDTLLHEQKKHKLTVKEWNDLLNNIDNIENAIESRQKPRYSGKPVLLKVKSGNNIFGVVLELFDKNNPVISTAFIDTENNIDNWLKNEAISYGTKTTFTNIRLNNIISNLKPDFKSFDPNFKSDNVGLKPNLQTAYHGTPHRFDEFSTDNRGNNVIDIKREISRTNGKHSTVTTDNNSINDNTEKFNPNVTNLEENIKKNFNDSVENITENVKADILNILQENDISEDEFNLQDIKIYGSYAKGKNKNTSDLDFIVQYSGAMSEDGAFNILNDEKLTIEDVNGRIVEIDINPINVDKSGTIDENLKYFDSLQDNTFYQEGSNIVDLTGDFEKTPTIDEVKTYINEIVENGTKFATLSPDWFVDVKKESSNRKQKRILDKIVNNGNFLKLDKQGKKRHNKYIMSLEKLLANAQYIGEKENTKKDKKPSIAKYHYFKTNVKIGDKTYEIIFDTEEYINDKTLSSDYTESYSLKKPERDTNSITDNNDGFNPKTVHLYNITELKKTKYYQNNNDFTENIFGEKKVNIDSKEEYDDFVDNFSSEETRASITFENKALSSPKAIIELFENADKSSFLHEIGHLFLQDIINAAKTNEHAKRELEAINKMLGHTQGEYTRAEHEKFAKGFEIYLMNGKAPNAGLKSAFDTFKSWLRKLYFL